MSAENRIVILTYGTRGDVEPFIALGVGLREAGHAVRIAGPAPFAALAMAYELEYVPIEGDPAELAQALSDQAGLNWVRMMVKGLQHVLPLAKNALSTIESATSDADLVIHSFLMTDAGHTFARMRGIPDLSAQFFPIFVPTSAFPAVAVPDLPLGNSYCRATHSLINGAFRYGSRLAYRMLRGSIPGAPDLAPWPFRIQEETPTPILFAYSPLILPRPADWPAHAHICGYWRPLPRASWEPEEGLVHYLESGEPPIYFGPGSVKTEKLQYLLRIVVEAARSFGQRLLLNVSPGALVEDLAGDDVFAIEGVPHAWLFPRMGYILHHGGAGTTGAAAASGVPSSAIPFTSDQAFWARRIHHLGLGPALQPARKLTVKHLELMLADVLGNPTYKEQAEDIGEKLRKEDGVTTAIGIIQKRLGERS